MKLLIKVLLLLPLVLLLLSLSLNLRLVIGIEPISSSIAAVLGSLVLDAIYSTWDYLKCSTQECCHGLGDNKAFVRKEKGWTREPWIDYELNQLEQSLNTELHGQHLVKNLIIKSIRMHMKFENPTKALVLSFHGWTGVGKTFVSEILAKSIFRKFRESGKSRFVRHILCDHFNTNDKQLLRQWIRDNVTEVVKRCPRSLIVFDEVHKLPVGVIDVIKPFIDYHNYVDSVDYRKTIFIFLSNTGATNINNLSYDFYLSGQKRTDITIKHLEPLITSGAFNEYGGLYKSDIIAKNLIDAFVPFLPLERTHIRLCIIDYLKQRYNKSEPSVDPGEEFIRNVMNELEFDRIYSKTGCKRVRNKVDVKQDN